MFSVKHIFLIDAAAQLKSKLWPYGPTFQMPCIPSAWTLISIRFICLLLPYFSIITLALCSSSQSYICWIGHSGNPYFARSFRFTHAAIVFKFQFRVRSRSLSEACQNQTLVNEKSLVKLSDAPHGPPSSAREVSFPAPPGLTPDKKESIGWPEGPPGEDLWKQEILTTVGISSPLSDGLLLQVTGNKQPFQQDKGILTARGVHCSRDVSWTELICFWHPSAAFTCTHTQKKV